MIEIATLAQALPATSPTTAPTTAAGAARGAAPEAAARFAELMAQDAPPAAVAPLAESVASAYPRGPATLGDQVLQGLQKVQSGFNEHVNAVGRMLEPGAPALGVPELLRLQLGMAQLAVQLEVVGKAVGRSTQNIDQLVRMQ